MLTAVKTGRKRCVLGLPWLEERLDCYTNSIFDHPHVAFIEVTIIIFCRTRILLVNIRQCSESDDQIKCQKVENKHLISDS